MLAWKCKNCTRHFMLRRNISSFLLGSCLLLAFVFPRTARTPCWVLARDAVNSIYWNEIWLIYASGKNRIEGKVMSRLCASHQSLVAGSPFNECECADQWGMLCVSDNQSRQSRAPQGVIWLVSRSMYGNSLCSSEVPSWLCIFTEKHSNVRFVSVLFAHRYTKSLSKLCSTISSV